jgi:hypothetical protein
VVGAAADAVVQPSQVKRARVPAAAAVAALVPAAGDVPVLPSEALGGGIGPQQRREARGGNRIVRLRQRRHEIRAPPKRRPVKVGGGRELAAQLPPVAKKGLVRQVGAGVRRAREGLRQLGQREVHVARDAQLDRHVQRDVVKRRREVHDQRSQLALVAGDGAQLLQPAAAVLDPRAPVTYRRARFAGGLRGRAPPRTAPSPREGRARGPSSPRGPSRPGRPAGARPARHFPPPRCPARRQAPAPAWAARPARRSAPAPRAARAHPRRRPPAARA